MPSSCDGRVQGSSYFLDVDVLLPGITMALGLLEAARRTWGGQGHVNNIASRRGSDRRGPQQKAAMIGRKAHATQPIRRLRE